MTGLRLRAGDPAQPPSQVLAELWLSTEILLCPNMAFLPFSKGPPPSKWVCQGMASLSEMSAGDLNITVYYSLPERRSCKIKHICRNQVFFLKIEFIFIKGITGITLYLLGLLLVGYCGCSGHRWLRPWSQGQSLGGPGYPLVWMVEPSRLRILGVFESAGSATVPRV